MNLTTTPLVAGMKLVEKIVDLFAVPPDVDGCIYLDYDPRTLRLRYLEAPRGLPERATA